MLFFHTCMKLSFLGGVSILTRLEKNRMLVIEHFQSAQIEELDHVVKKFTHESSRFCPQIHSKI